MDSVHENIRRYLSAFYPGQILVPADFRGRGSQDAIKMSLSRLVKSGELKRIAHGIYYKPMFHTQLGEMLPSPEAIAEQLAEKEKVRIRPTGSFALNKLGLSTQVPTKLTYLTDGHPRKIRVGKMSIEFKASTPKKMALSGTISGSLILALEELDLDNLEPDQEKRIRYLIQISRDQFYNDLKLAPAKVYNYISKIITELDDTIFNIISEA
ncbi:DUF6088 family protein [Paraflavitalea sp. CAU 1676]|uniref:DUF6088 family protein n=1 Tax=Paraflavitalea sp. CAU 1676 TaxID=3032598 RepID=UPI0023DCDB8E|nr:DUF6088 family protein [Paraflavitalea sp. CAU 1676]MDF2189820.1 DUF6088 family protein [Paraflavitalea sp. CAU 1676]